MNNPITRILLSLGLGCTLAFALPQAATKTKNDNKATERSAQSENSNLVNLNSASQKDLEALPGVGAASAKKIVAGRPYASVTDLQKAGLSAKTIEKITPLVTAGGSAPSTNPSTSATDSGSGSKSNSQQSVSSSTRSKVNLNAASQQELEALPNVGAATAKKIIANRPYASTDDLSKAGISKSKIDKLSGLVSVGAASASASQQTADPVKSSSKESSGGMAPSPASQTGSVHVSPGSMSRATTDSQATAQQPPHPGMVWANLDTKVYHQPGHRWYGKTKHGQFMTEEDAIKAGFRASKE